ncbi:hypothetical protein [Brevundimonas sp.]|uniref:GltB/FmdC/FwdC-like GXGXG domain-containing protein n=1 Tax=Brevundimonas sp. TaxID=1871086 RepID=UPI00391B2F69
MCPAVRRLSLIAALMLGVTTPALAQSPFDAGRLNVNIRELSDDAFQGRGIGGVAEDNVIAGNVVAYGATSGEIFIRGICGERFCVRNSGAEAVVEGTGDHACEYMTGGRAVVLGETGRNFAAGMSGGIAYVWDSTGGFRPKVNKEMVELEELDAADLDYVRGRIARHVELTGSDRGRSILDAWETERKRFVKVMPIDYKRALAELRKLAEQDQQDAKRVEVKVNG